MLHLINSKTAVCIGKKVTGFHTHM